LTAKTGLLNKSAKDPYTNLLRQTTEVMSAVIGGAQTIIVTPYDAQTEKGISELSDRMATNISLILKEESYFDAVIDPLGGSYAIEKLTEELTNKGWKLFQDIEGMGGMHNFEARELLKVLVQHTRTIRLSEYEEKKRTLIGVTKFPNIQTVENSYIPAWKYLGMDNLIIERDMNYGN
jgi:methylmalonyl-CoA mutase